MSTRRFRLALAQLTEADWEPFERLCSAFLAPEFGNLRTMASPSGDGGRDAVLFCSESRPEVVFQYSVTKDWARKIRGTIKRLAEAEEADSAPTVLVYMSSQEIGAAADSVRQFANKEAGMFLDIRDRHWFVERMHQDVGRERVAEELAVQYVDPLLPRIPERPSIAGPLSASDAKTAFTYLELTWQSSDPNKNLRKVAFEALTLAALSGTNADNRLARADVHQRVIAMVPLLERSVIKNQVDASLRRLAKKRVRHHKKNDEFCLAYEETKAQTEALLELAERDAEYRDAVSDLAAAVPEERREHVVERAIWITERYLLKAGEDFAAAVATESNIPVADSDLNTAAALSQEALGKTASEELQAAVDTAKALLLSRHPRIAVRVRDLAAEYTLFALLRQTPDVQKVTRTMFSFGDIWLDASVCLPLLAETIDADDEAGARFTKLIAVARGLGMTFHVIPGVLEELERHINRARTYVRWSGPKPWQGGVPFLCAYYIRSGADPARFVGWTELFCGVRRPIDDIAQFLLEEHGIEVSKLVEDLGCLPQQMRDTLSRLWLDAHTERRRGRGVAFEPATIKLLADHDVESFGGIVGRRLRGNEGGHPLGFKSWWLTIDSAAYRIAREMQRTMAVVSPIMSPDFLARQMVFHVGDRPHRDSWHFPFMDVGISETIRVPRELIDIAEKVRREYADLPERVLRRRVRDALDSVKSDAGDIAQSCLDGFLLEATE